MPKDVINGLTHSQTDESGAPGEKSNELLPDSALYEQALLMSDVGFSRDDMDEQEPPINIDTDKPLNQKQQIFALQMAKPSPEGKPNAAAAARDSGYTESSAKQRAKYLLNIPKIQKQIKENKERLAKLSDIEGSHIMGAMVELAFLDRGAILKAAWNEDTECFDWNKLAESGYANCVEAIINTPTKYGTKTEIRFYNLPNIFRILGEWLNIKSIPREQEEKIRRVVQAIVDYKQVHPEFEIERIIEHFSKGRAVPAEIVREKVMEKITEKVTVSKTTTRIVE